jgi:hypothetical protein
MIPRKVLNSCQGKQNIIKGQPMHFRFIDKVVLHSGHQHVPAIM